MDVAITIATILLVFCFPIFVQLAFEFLSWLLTMTVWMIWNLAEWICDTIKKIKEL